MAAGTGSISAVITGRVVQLICGAVGVGIWVLVLYAGLSGTDDPPFNFAIVFLFYTFWLGMVLASVVLGDVFRAFNPWRAIGRTFSGAFRLVAGQSAPAPLEYPDRLGRWPAVIGVLAFVWLELVAGGVAQSPSPAEVATATAIYSGITFVCMGLFGVDEWIRRGEAFSAYFEMFSGSRHSRCATGGWGSASSSPAPPRGRRCPVRQPWCSHRSR